MFASIFRIKNGCRMLKYLMGAVFLFHIGCLSVDKNFSSGETSVEDFCRRKTAENSDVNRERSKKQYEQEYNECLAEGVQGQREKTSSVGAAGLLF